jgi:tetratricopeptide (TPR) repeat protein
VLYLHSVGDRNSTKHNQSPGLPGTTVKHQSEPLSRERLDEAVAIYRGLCSHPGRSTVDVELLDGLLRELHVSGYLDTAGALYLEATKTVDSADDICDLLWIENGVADLRALQHLMDRLLIVPDSSVNVPAGSPNAFRQSAFELISISLISAIERADRIDDLMESWNRYVAIHKRDSTDSMSMTHGSGPIAWKNTRPVYNARIFGARNGYRALPVSHGFTMLPGLVFKNDGLSILNALWNRYARDRRDEELIRSFKSAVENPEIAEDDRIYRQHGLAYLQWISGRRDAALAILVDVARHHPKRRDLQVGLIQQYELADQPDAALAVLDTLDRTIDEVVNDALLAANGIELNVAGFLDRIELRLAIAANQLERGRRVVGRLQSKIGPQEIAEFTQQMLQLGMKEEAEQALIAARQRAQLDIRQQRVLMDVQMSLGKNEAAGTTAASLLAQVDGPLGARASMTNMRLTMVNGQIVETYDKLDIVEFKKACFDVLRNSGRLDKMIETAESQLKSLPKSTATIEQLITLQDAAGNKGRVDELLALKRQITSDRPENRFTLSLKLLEQDKLDESLEQMKILLERDADDFSSRCRNTLFRYDGSQMLAKFASQLTKLDWTANETRSAALLSIIDQLHARTATSDVADRFFATLWMAQPERRIGLLERFQASHWWDLPDVHQGLRTALATPPDRLQDQWAVFGRVLPVEGKDRLTTVLNRAMTEAAVRGELDAFASDIQRGIQSKPEWQAGQVMLAMLDLRRNRIDTASKTLETFLPTLEPQLRKSPNIAWEIGQELVRTDQGLEIGVKYFDFAIRYQGRADWVSSASPAGALIDTYVALGKKQDAREMLQKNVPQSLRPNPEPNSTVTALDVAHLLSIGRKLRSLGYPVDSIEIYLAALERLKGIGPGGYDPRNELQGCLALAFGELKPEALVEYLEEPASRTRPLRLHLFLWQNNPERSILTTRWNPILFTIAADQNLATKARRALSKLIEAQPTAVEPLVLSAHLSQSMKDAEAFAGHAKKLLDLINAQPLPKRRNDSSPETGQEALWLIARDCLATPSLAQAGEELANRAVDAALLDVRPDFEVAILKEWILLAERSGDDNRVGRLKKKLDAAELR